MLETKPVDRAMMLRPLQPIGGVSWMSGKRFTAPVPRPIFAKIVDGYEEDTVPRVYAPAVPMMRDDLLALLRSSGVDNIDSYPLVIRNDVTGEKLEGYSAINIVGVLRAADPAGTSFWPDNPSRLVDADIDSLKIELGRTGGALLFRLAEAITGVVVHERIKKAVEAAGGFPGLRFVVPENWMG